MISHYKRRISNLKEDLEKCDHEEARSCIERAILRYTSYQKEYEEKNRYAFKG